MKPQDQSVEVLFPLAGINVATEFGRPPKATSPLGKTVRAYEVLARRCRGGSALIPRFWSRPQAQVSGRG